MTVLVGFLVGQRKMLVLRFLATKRESVHLVNGLLWVDAMSGEEDLQLKSKAKSQDIASYFGLLCDDLSSQGDPQVTIIRG